MPIAGQVASRYSCTPICCTARAIFSVASCAFGQHDRSLRVATRDDRWLDAQQSASGACSLEDLLSKLEVVYVDRLCEVLLLDTESPQPAKEVRKDPHNVFHWAS